MEETPISYADIYNAIAPYKKIIHQKAFYVEW